MDPVDELQPRQIAMYEAYCALSDALGQFDQSSGPNGAHYMGEDDNPFTEEGLMCANCVFYEGGQACHVVSGSIAPMGLCKLWIINGNLLDGTVDKAGFGGNRSAAGAYAANIRWSRRGGNATTEVDALVERSLTADMAHNLFDDKVSGLEWGIPADGLLRSEMPQVPSQDKERFLGEIAQQGVTYQHTTAVPSSLRPTQREASARATAEILGREERKAEPYREVLKDSIMVSKDGHVLDGHHRWAAARLSEAKGKPVKISVIRLNVTKEQAFRIMRAYNAKHGTRIRTITEHDTERLRKQFALEAEFVRACRVTEPDDLRYAIHG